MTRRRWIGLVLAVLLIGGTAAWALLRPSGEPQVSSRSFTATAERSDQTATVGLTGTLSPRTQSNLNFGVSGTVTKVYVSAGDTVKKGEKLARIDDDDLVDALALAQANLDTAQANLDDVEDAGSDAAITAAKAQVRSAKAAVTSAEADLDSAVLRSSIAGTVASVDLSVGDTVSASSSSGSSGGGSGSGGTAGGTGIPGSTSSTGSTGSTGSTSTGAQVVVISTDAWKLDGTVGSADLASLKTGQVATVTPDGASEPIPGKVTSIGIVATSSEDGSATFPVEVSLDGKHPGLFSGTTGSASITVAEYSDVLTVPTPAITTRDGKAVVTKVDGDTTSEVEVTVGRVFGDATEITAGLAEGDTVQITVRMPQRDPESGDGGLFGGGGGFGPPDRGGEPPSGGQPPTGGGAPGGNGGGNR